jgi:hypothetical protein
VRIEKVLGSGAASKQVPSRGTFSTTENPRPATHTKPAPRRNRLAAALDLVVEVEADDPIEQTDVGRALVALTAQLLRSGQTYCSGWTR